MGGNCAYAGMAAQGYVSPTVYVRGQIDNTRTPDSPDDDQAISAARDRRCSRHDANDDGQERHMCAGRECVDDGRSMTSHRTTRNTPAIYQKKSPRAFPPGGPAARMRWRRQGAAATACWVRRGTVTQSTNTSNTNDRKLLNAVSAADGRGSDSNMRNRGGKCARVFRQTTRSNRMQSNASQ